MNDVKVARRRLVLGAAAATMVAGAAQAQSRTDTAPRILNGETVPEPSEARSAGPVRPGRGSDLKGKVAVVTGAARGIGRAIAVELAANGADVVALDIAGPVSTASNAVPATPEELAETVKQIQGYGRRSQAVRADIRDIAALRAAANQIEQQFGKIDIVVANAAIVIADAAFVWRRPRCRRHIVPKADSAGGKWWLLVQRLEEIVCGEVLRRRRR